MEVAGRAADGAAPRRNMCRVYSVLKVQGKCLTVRADREPLMGRSSTPRSTTRRQALCIAAAASAIVLGSALLIGRLSVVAAARTSYVSAPHRSLNQSAPPTTTTAVPAISPATAACQRAGRQKCAPSDYLASPAHFPLASLDPAGARLLTRAQILSMSGFARDTVAASLMTYRQAQAAFPDLAAEGPLVVNPHRVVWVVTAYLPHPISESFCRSISCPPGVASQRRVTIVADSMVLDAMTGDAPDQCRGCAVLPRPHVPAARARHLQAPSINHVSDHIPVGSLANRTTKHMMGCRRPT